MEDFLFFPAENNKFDIDILVPVYNHEKYIAKALDSILMQQTKFSFRIIIGEDCSTDKSREIILEYYKNNKDKVSLILWNKNVGPQKNTYYMCKYCKAPYVACLEGDDYWTNPFKLEKQVSFLEKNSDYAATYHNVRCVNEEGNLLHKDFNFYPIQEEFYLGYRESLNFNLPGQSASVVFRNFIINMEPNIYDKFFMCATNGDMKFKVMINLTGKIYFFRDIMADHVRSFKGDSWTAKTSGKNMLHFRYKSNIEMIKLMKLLDVEKDNFIVSINDYINSSYLELLNKFNFNNVKTLFLLLLELIKGRCFN